MSDTPSPADAPASPRWRFRLSCLIAAAWWTVLIGVAVTSTNPVVFDQRQLRLSDSVVLARVIDRAAGTVEVEASWKGEVPRGRITIHSLADSKPELTGSSLLIPLTFWAVGYEVTPIPPPGRGRLVYPATPHAREQLDELFKPAND